MTEAQQEQSTDQVSSAEADLALIRKMMQEAQNSAAIDGRFLVLWGCILGLTQALILFMSNVLAYADGVWILYVWYVMLGIGICGSIFLAYLHSRSSVNAGVRTYASIWIGFCLTIFLLFILAVSGQGALLLSLVIIAPAMTGLAFFATAAIIGLGWLRWVALGWWLTAIFAALFNSSPFIEVISIAAYLALMAGPGLAITRLGKKA